jgi:serine/threonine protein kinase
MIKHHPLTGEVLCFGLCGDILRGHFLSPQRFGNTRGFSMENEEDYLDIVKMVALFSGPVGNFMPRWGPKAGDTILIRTPKKCDVHVTLDKVSLLESRFGPYGRRTTVWQAEAKLSKGKGEKGSHGVNIAPGEVLIIKASWLLSRLARWEATVYEHIAEKEAERFKLTGVKRDPDIGLPEFIGQVIDASQTESLGPYHLSQWESRQVPKRNIPGKSMERACASIFVTKCFPARTIDRANLSLTQLAKIYLGLFKTLNYLAALGVHYRDLNLGNILYELSSGTRCLLTDFDSARLNLRSRGDLDLDEQQNKAWDISIDDAMSGNVLFQSRSAHAARECCDRLEVAIFAKVQAEANLEKVQAEKDPSAKMIIVRKGNLKRAVKSVDDLVNELRGHRHRYLDDLESAIYTMLWVVGLSMNRPLHIRELIPYLAFSDCGTRRHAGSSSYSGPLDRYGEETDLGGRSNNGM